MEGLLKGLGQLRHTLEKREVWAVTEKQGLQNQITTLCGLIQTSLPHNEDKPDGQKSSSKQPRSMKLSAGFIPFCFHPAPVFAWIMTMPDARKSTDWLNFAQGKLS
jgi:hypothetical protein